MNIAHVSIPADDCRAAAGVLAEIMDGQAVPFPPGGPDAWMAWAGDGSVEIEVTPRGSYMAAGPSEVVWCEGPAQRSSETHVALCVDRPAADVLEIARNAGWTARVCDRAGFFHVVELWVENSYLIEVLDPAFTSEYRESMTLERWVATFPVSDAPPDAIPDAPPR